jgi:pilus assembly protein FimV
MLRGPYPALLMLAMTVPGAGWAMGLGDIRVNSALNEPLSAQIEILGATSEELGTVSARIADPDAFDRYGADRPSYLRTVTFEVGTDSQGRPVLEVRSADPCPEPVLTVVVDVRWHTGELIRDYALLLDPVVSTSASRTPAAPAAMAATAPVPSTSVAPQIQPAPPAPIVTAPADAAARAPAAQPLGLSYRVRAGDTLRTIVRRAGARADLDAQRMMIAVFRANPQSFDGNINLLHRGAVLSLPSMDRLSGMDAIETKSAVAEQMRTWRHRDAAAILRPAAAEPAAAPANARQSAEPIDADALRRRVRSLEEALDTSHQQLADVDAAIHNLQQLAAQSPAAPVAAPAKAAARPVAAPAGSRLKAGLLSPVAAALGLLLVVLVLLRGRRPAPAAEPSAAAEPAPLRQPDTNTAEPNAVPAVATAKGAATVDVPAPDTAALGSESPEVSTLDILEKRTDMDLIRSAVLDYNLVDLDSSAVHVHMPSDLNDRPVPVERRTSVADALRAAIKRDPRRRDLRMKLLETYYSLASVNQRAFLEFARAQLAEPQMLTAEDWQQIAEMGREIAPENSLIVELQDKDLLDCA